jgi:hypothetical protein
MMAAMEKSVAQGRSVQFSSMVCNSMEGASFEPRYSQFRTTWASLLGDMTQVLTSHQRFPASSVTILTHPRHHYHHSCRSVFIHVATGRRILNGFISFTM